MINSILGNVTQYLTTALYIIPVMLISLTLHECAHGYMAYRLGDPTAHDAGRLSLNPFRHLDPIGALMMLLVHFGWAKPVPVNPMYFKNPKKGMMLTAIAGPVANMLIAILSSFLLVTNYYLSMYTFAVTRNYIGIFKVIEQFLMYMTFVNIGLAFFNLIPVYPLDGSRILQYILPNSFTGFLIKYGNYIYIAFFVLVLATDWVGNAISAVQQFFFSKLIFLWNIPFSAILNLFVGGLQ